MSRKFLRRPRQGGGSRLAEELLLLGIIGAACIVYSAGRNVVEFQLNGHSDGMMLDGLPGLAGTNNHQAVCAKPPNPSLLP